VGVKISLLDRKDWRIEQYHTDDDEDTDDCPDDLHLLLMFFIEKHI
jgi:hypothetical protein